MGTIILAYVVAVLGLVMVAGGVWGLFHLLREGARLRIRLRHYAMAIGMICVGFAMGGIAQALRLLVGMAAVIPP
jgi:hypothetical protein